MNKLIFLLISACIASCSMELQTSQRDRSNSIIIEIEPGSPSAVDYARKMHPFAYKLVHKAMNGNSDAFVIKTIGKSLERDREGKLYKELRQTRKALQKIAESKKGKSKIDRDEITEYIIKELSENVIRKKDEVKLHKKQKIIIASIGLVSTIATSVSAALAAYYSH